MVFQCLWRWEFCRHCCCETCRRIQSVQTDLWCRRLQITSLLLLQLPATKAQKQYQSINHSIDRSIDQSINQLLDRSIVWSIDQSINQSIDHSVSHPVSQPRIQSVSLSVKYIFYIDPHWSALLCGSMHVQISCICPEYQCLKFAGLALHIDPSCIAALCNINFKDTC